MTSITRTLARYVLHVSYEQLPHPVVFRVKQALLDTLGVAVPGYGSESSHIVRAVQQSRHGSVESTVFGTGEKTSCDVAAVVNGVMVRYLDYNDTITRPRAKGTHPSEVIPMVLALGERQHAPGTEVLTTIAVGYELLSRFVMGQVEIPEGYGWANSIWFPYVMPLLAGRLLGLTEDEVVNAVGICGMQNLTLGVIDAEGEAYNMAKNLQVPLIAQAAIRAAALAKEGYTGPERILEGHKGFYEVVVRERFHLPALTEGLGRFTFLDHHVMKWHCAETGIQATLDATVKLVTAHPLRPTGVESVTVRTNRKAFDHTGDPAKRHPTNKETADHSHAYAVAVAIVDGRVGPQQYSLDKLRDPVIHALIDRVTVEPDPRLDDLYPASIVEITTTTGETYRCQVTAAKGSPQNPLSNNEVTDKFRALASPSMDPRQMEELIDRVYYLDHQPDIGELLGLMTWDE